MRLLLAPRGSEGDVNPFIGMGCELARRGHDVTLLTNGYFRHMVEAAGLRFAPTDPAEVYEKMLADPRMSTRFRSNFLAMNFFRDGIEGTYRTIEEYYIPGETLVVAQGFTYGARIANEKLGVPLATVHLYPICLWSTHERLTSPDRIPEFLPTALQAVRDSFLDHTVGLRIRKVRSQLGLKRASGLLRTWWNSPDLVLGFFPDWFAPPSSEWPPNFHPVGFSFYDGSESHGPSAALDAFLDAGTPPVVFSQASNMKHANDYFRTSVEVAQTLGRRAILLTPHRSQVPDVLPEGIRHFDYLPYGTVLPRAVAHVHHAGIGTSCQALRAGIPQLLVPRTFDQPDNAGRLKKLGVCATVRPGKYQKHRVVKQLQGLLESPDVAVQCRIYADRCREMDAVQAACTELERVFVGMRHHMPMLTS